MDFCSSNIGKIFILDIGIQWVAFIFANSLKTEKFYDLTGELSTCGMRSIAYFEHCLFFQRLFDIPLLSVLES